MGRNKGRDRQHQPFATVDVSSSPLTLDVGSMVALMPEVGTDLLKACGELLCTWAGRSVGDLESIKEKKRKKPLLQKVSVDNLGQRGNELFAALDDETRNRTEGYLYEFRVTQEARLWGYIIDDVFFALWWDPKHEVLG